MAAEHSDRLAERKHERRLEVLERRALRRRSHRLAADRLRTPRLMAAIPPGVPVALYASTGEEPDTTEAISQLLDRGSRVLLPVVSGTGVSRPRWAWIASLADLLPGRWGIPEPQSPALSPAVLAEVDLVVCPAVAVSLNGGRLGTGGGWYDRVLHHRRPGVQVWALSNDDEVYAELPQGAHDLGIDRIITPTRTITTTR